jgi:hydrogenase nickel incorporation protein HypB
MELNILSENDRIAAENQALLKSRGIVAINLISSPGSGKTALLEKTLDMLKGDVPCAVIVGDQRSDEDAKRLQGRGAPVTQIETGDACHLNAGQVTQALEKTLQPDTKLLFIENVGNLVCPAAFDLGEDFKVALLSAPEGENKPLKYPSLFNAAKAVIITKTDLCPYLEWDIEKCRQYIRNINPGVLVFELSSRSGKGMNSWISYLKALL